MTDKEQLRILMENSLLAHKEFKNEWAKWVKYDPKFKQPEPREVTLARNKFNQENGALYIEIWKHDRDFFDFETVAGIDYFIGFCEIDIPAFRCGYAKQTIFKRLKHYSLNDDQKSRLCRLALDLCLSSSYRIEIKELTRLMIKLADKEFTKELIELTQNLSIIVKNKSERMLGIIRHHRKDLFEN